MDGWPSGDVESRVTGIPALPAHLGATCSRPSCCDRTGERAGGHADGAPRGAALSSKEIPADSHVKAGEQHSRVRKELQLPGPVPAMRERCLAEPDAAQAARRVHLHVRRVGEAATWESEQFRRGCIVIVIIVVIIIVGGG